ncbi:hypothetical protein R83H12_00279 [Fibrobacteria bacterium R8-3-H12]
MDKMKPSLLAATLWFAVVFTSLAFAGKVHLNQIGFGATAQKQAVYNGTPSGTIAIKSIGGGTVNQTITPDTVKTWSHSGEATNRVLDFSSVTAPWHYALYENGSQISPVFQIGVSYDQLARDALRFYYYHRAGTPISTPYAERFTSATLSGSFTRSAGHSNMQATVYNAAGLATSTTIALLGMR